MRHDPRAEEEAARLIVRRCPHKLVQHCPLYVASHEAGPGCDDGKLENGKCAVDRGMDYGARLAQLTAVKPMLVAECAFREAKPPKDGLH